MKVKGLSIANNIKNNFQMLAMVCRVDAWYVCITLLVRILSGIRTAFLYVYLLGIVLYLVENKKGLISILLFLAFCLIFLAIAFAVEAYYNHVFKPIRKERIVSQLQSGLFDKLQIADMINYDSADMYTTVTLANKEIATRPIAITENIFRGFESLIATVTIILGTTSTNWFVFGICMLSFVVGIFFTNIRSKKVVQYDEQMKIKDKKISLLRRFLYLPEYAKDNRLSHIHDTFLSDYQATVQDKEEIARSSGKQIANLSFWQNLFCSAFCIDFLIPLYLGIAILLFGKLSISEFVIAINAGYQIQQRLDELTSVVSEFFQNGRFAERIHNISTIQCDIETTVGTCSVDTMQTLSADNVTFFYPDGTLGLSGINLNIPKGSKVAIVGRNGSGKSTLIKLLLRFYDPTSGEILQNGVDIRNFDISTYRSQFSAAYQDFKVYSTSIKNNVCMGAEVDEGRLADALHKAGLAEQINDLDTPLTKEIDENGVLFSGGLLQRLTLARVFYQDRDIVIMDEPTAAMDVLFERKFYDTVFQQLQEKTVIFVSHRLSSVAACDKIIYMDHGRIVEEGTHEYLMNLQGEYYKLFKAQYD